MIIWSKSNSITTIRQNDVCVREQFSPSFVAVASSIFTIFTWQIILPSQLVHLPLRPFKRAVGNYDLYNTQNFIQRIPAESWLPQEKKPNGDIFPFFPQKVSTLMLLPSSQIFP